MKGLKRIYLESISPKCPELSSPIVLKVFCDLERTDIFNFRNFTTALLYLVLLSCVQSVFKFVVVFPENK